MAPEPLIFGLTVAEFEDISLKVCFTGLIAYMVFIIGHLAWESKAGKYGAIWMFVGLGPDFSVSSPKRNHHQVSASTECAKDISAMSNSFDGVSVDKAANVYFDGKCISHNLIPGRWQSQVGGVVLPASLTFKTGAPEVMEAVGGSCRVRLEGAAEWRTCTTGESFQVPAN